jgi:hypothetical protein
MLADKRPLGVDELEAQTALELPDREMMALINIVVVDVLNNNEVAVQVPIGVAANVCGIQANVLAQGGVQEPVDCTSSTTQDLPVAFRP